MVLGAGCLLLDACYWVLGAGFWVLVTGSVYLTNC
jgi:hypothetical protein